MRWKEHAKGYSMKSSYFIITPAYNEEKYIGRTIESVIAQSVRPDRWIVVDDGSTDGTAKIVTSYATKYPWICYVFRPKVPGQSYYSSNVYAIAEGFRHLNGTKHDFVAILDADISLPPTYYEELHRRFLQEEMLGIASGVYLVEDGGKLRGTLHDRRSCPKNIMVFRSECYDEIGGFLPLKYGGEDTCACYMARMHGWKTWSFPDLKAVHHKPVGAGQSKSLVRIRFRQGIGEYFLATQPLFLLLKSIRRCFREPPYVIGGLARFAGFCCGPFVKEKWQLSEDVVRYIQKEQLGRVLRCNTISGNLAVTK